MDILVGGTPIAHASTASSALTLMAPAPPVPDLGIHSLPQGPEVGFLLDIGLVLTFLGVGAWMTAQRARGRSQVRAFRTERLLY
jgi:hypothetical protein